MFLIFDAIYTEGGVTPAAKRLNLTQPAVSHALSRLRDSFGDPLFVRNGRAITPTPLARRIVSSVRQSIHELHATMDGAGRFDPAIARFKFTIGMRDILEISLLPELIAKVRRLAPHVEFSIVKVNRRQLEAELAAGVVDVAIDVRLPLSAEVRYHQIMDPRLCVLASKKHQRLQRRLSLKAYLAEQHVVVTSRRKGQSIEDVELSHLGHRRKVRLRCQHYFAAARIVCHTDLLCSMTEPTARILGELLPVQVLRFPLRLPHFGAFLYWHSNFEADPANSWLRTQIIDAATRTAT
ncbi:LysR family transcriptional regulator [Bradyrhizobium mercantei]|uniref:LysR family transcriptional regulator n=1 Tax=Bradyrhizobium mercantei TaxID=1904807 RepID=UPI001AECF1D8|nr:LysR family transcriptional regulator [Bradyrhizobium mercantei]